MKILFTVLLLVPLSSAILVSTVAKKSERLISLIVAAVSWVLGICVTSLLVVWGMRGFSPFEWEIATLYKNGSYDFPLVLYFDRFSAAFLVMTTYMFLITARFSRYYMHREVGYSRFFSTVLIFIFGMFCLVLAGTVDLFFAGWEIVGISSFLLIAFYRLRVTPVRNALTVYGVYRVCDIGVLLGAWMAHVIWHKSQLFSSLAGAMSVVDTGSSTVLVLCLFILVAAAGKSAQFPFCFWLPRAMEGPTPSSAIFYGALSVHAGVFLLMRTLPVWQSVSPMPWLIGSLGLLSAILATVCGRTQSNIKGQIAYASQTQVGIMLIELAAGFPTLALIHFVGNAGLRSYQLLVSPSVVAYVLRMQGTPGTQRRVSEWSLARILPSKIRSTLYVFSLNEGYLLAVIQALVLKPLASFGNAVHSLDGRGGRILGGLVGFAMLGLVFDRKEGVPVTWAAIVACLLAVAASLSALSERQSALRAWNAVGFSCFYSAIAIGFYEGHFDQDTWVYLSGVIPPWLIGVLTLRPLTREINPQFQLETYWGQAHAHPRLVLILFLCLLAMAGFPIGPAFVGEDALLHHIVGSDGWVVAAYIFTFILNGISLIRLFTRVSFGPYAQGKPSPEHVLLN